MSEGPSVRPEQSRHAEVVHHNVSPKMKFLVKVEGGQSPGVTIAGEQKDLVALAEQLKAGAESKTEGLIPLPQAEVEGEPHEWIAFEVVRSFPQARDAQKVKAAPAKLAVVGFVLVMVVLCYLAYRGIQTF